MTIVCAPAESVSVGDASKKEEDVMPGQATEKSASSEAMRNMLNEMAYLALCYAIKGQRKGAEMVRQMARQLHRDYRECLDLRCG